MIGVLLVTHSNAGEVLIKNAEYITGNQLQVGAVSQRPGSGFQYLKSLVMEEIKRLEQGQGVLLLTDIYGGTPSKVALSFVEENNNVVVVTGLNLAMLLKVLELDREKLPLDEVGRIALDSGKRSISLVGDHGNQSEGSNADGARPQTSNLGEAETTVTVLNSAGLHASNSAKLTKAASAFLSEIFLVKGDMRVNTKSIMGVLMLGATQGTELLVQAKGDDARLAIETIKGLFENKFGEE